MSKVGFAAMKESNPDRLRELASAGGKRVHELGKGHVFTEEERMRAIEARHKRPLSAEARTLDLFPGLR